MPAIHGGVSDATLEALQDSMVESGDNEDQAEAVEFCIRYTLIQKYGYDPEQLEDDEEENEGDA